MIRIYHLIIILSGLLVSVYTPAQPVCIDKTLILNGPPTCETVTARDWIKLNPGFYVNTGSSFKALVDESLIFNTSYLSAPPPVSRTLDFNNAVGTLPGYFNVNATGSATYTIPLEVPPGTAGMKPGISLFYSSMAENGIMGIGWSIGGISMVSRVGQDRFNEGDIRQVDYTTNDRLMLDGQRLILSSGSWFSTNSEYKTQVETFKRIKYTGTSFEVETPDGLVLYFGETPESRLRNSGGIPLNWHITRAVDRFGNTINYVYKYISSTKEILIDRIEYTKTNSFVAYNKVQFTYENSRTDFMMRYHAGIKVNADHLLKRISIYANGYKIKELSFNYFKDNNADSYLSSIEQTGENGLKTNSTQVNWVTRPLAPSYPTYLFFHEDEEDLSQYIENPTPLNIRILQTKMNGVGEKYTHVTLDADGDGVSDILSIPSGTAPPTNLNLRYNRLQSLYSMAMPAYTGAFPIDWDGDGKEELFFHRGHIMEYQNGFALNNQLSYRGAESITGSQLQFKIMKFSGNSLVDISTVNNYGISGLQNLTYKIYQADYDGNGTTDLLFASPGTSDVSYQLYLSENVSGNISFVKRSEGNLGILGTFYQADLNGDGKQDLICSNATGISISFLTKIPGSSNYAFSTWNSIKSGGNVSGLGDFNGDGMADIFDEDNEKIYFSTGVSSPVLEEQEYPDATDRFVGPDCNSDGTNEIMSHSINSSTATLTVHYLNDGTSSSISLIDNYHNLYQFLFGDFDGDGIMDKLYYYASAETSQQYQYSHTVLRMDLSPVGINRKRLFAGSFLNGLNQKTSVVYDYTAHSSTYSMNETPSVATPVRVINPRLMVVKSVNADNGKGGCFLSDYKYENARIHIDGKGFLGYGKITVTDVTAGMKTVTTNAYNSTVYDPLPVSTVTSTTTSPVKNISGSNYGFKYHSYGTGGQKHYIIYPDTVSNYDFLSAFKNKTTYTFNTTYGNWTQMVNQSYLTSPSLTLRETKTTDNTFESYLGGKFYRIKTTSITALRPSQSPAKAKRSYNYLNANCTRISRELIYYYDPVTGAEDSDKDTVSYGYTSLGNVNQVTSQLDNIKRTNSYQMESLERFNRVITDPLGNITITEFNNKGLLTSLRDPNNNYVGKTYDGFGRLVIQDNPDESDRTDSIKWVKSGDKDAPQYAVYYQKVIVAGKPFVKTYCDVLGRALRTVTVAQNNKLIFTDVIYNDKGQQVQASMPYFKGDTIRWTYTTYYNDGRVQSTYVDNNIKKVTFTYDKNKVTQTMNNTGQVYTKTYDPTGVLIEATDPGGTNIYDYYSSGGLKSVIAPACTTAIEYDKYHKQKKITDPNAGTIEFEYNAYGEIMYQKDARGNWFRYTSIDKLGRPLIKASSDGSIVNFTYDTDFKGALYCVSHSNGMSSQYEHDAWGRVIRQKETIGGTLYETTMDYDLYSNIQKVTYPSAFNVSYTYTANGYLSQVKHTNNSVALWSAGDVNAFGEWKSYTLGSAINRTFTYNVYGMTDEIKTGTIQSLKYVFDVETGNLTSRGNVLKNLTESFTYNGLDQLTSWKVGTTTYNIGYLSDGTSRINSKTDAGTYVYGSTPDIHQVTGIGNNPGTLNSANAVIDYNSFNKLAAISETGAFRQEFTYGADEQRRISKLFNGNNTLVKETVYVPGGYELEKRGTNIRQLYYIPVGDCYALYTKNNAGADSLYFILTDHLGSVHQITNTNGTVLKEMSFDPWGRRRNPNDWNYNNIPAVSITNRGFTMHEHMDHFKLINMNGRVYDPVLGQFLSPDPFIADPASTMSYNRYAYCNYNPLKYTDPSGYRIHKSEVADFYKYYYEMVKEWNEANSSIRGGGGSSFGGVGGGLVDVFLSYTEARSDGYMGDFFQFIDLNDVMQNALANGLIEPGQTLGIEYYTGEYFIVDPIMNEGWGAYTAVKRETAIYEFTVPQGQGGNGISPQGYRDLTGVLSNPYIQPGDQFWMEFGMAAGAFARNYRDMRKANTVGADKYFHCKANFEAASFGPGGLFFAEHFSNLREIWDQNIKGYPRWDSVSDQEANQWGRDQVREALNSCKACQKFRPAGLPDKY